MKLKKQLSCMILALTIGLSMPLSAMNSSKIDITESFQTMLNFLSEFGVQVGEKGIKIKETLIQEALKHPQIAKGLAAYLGLCYLRSLINKKGYNSINGKISPLEFIGDGIANIWRIPLDGFAVIRKRMQMMHEKFPTGFNLGLWILPLAASPLLVDKFIKTSIYKNSLFLTKIFGKEPNSNAYFTLLTMSAPIITAIGKYLLEVILIGDQAKAEKDRQDKLFGSNKENKKKLHNNFKKGEWFGPMPDKAEKFIKNLKDDYENAPRTMLLNGPTGTGKTELAKVTSNYFGATEENDRLVILTGNDTIAKYGGVGNERVNDAVNKIIDSAEKNPHQMHCFIVDEVEEMARKRGGEKSEESGILTDKVGVSQGFRAKIDDINNGGIKNIIVIGTTNFKNKIDSAIKDQFKIQITLKNPDDADRKELIEGFITQQAKNQKKYSIDDTALEYLTTMTDGLTKRNIKDLCAEIKLIKIENNNTTKISLDNTELVFEINKLLQEKLKNALSNCSEDKDEFYQENLKIVEKTIQKLEQAHFKLVILNDLHIFKNILENKQEIFEIKETCIKNLNEYYETLQKTPEQIFLAKQLESLEKIDYNNDETIKNNVSNEIKKYFQYGKHTSLYEQIKLIKNIIKEFENISTSKNKEKSCKTIKNLLNKLQDSVTYSTVNEIKDELEKKVEEIDTETFQEIIDTDTIEKTDKTINKISTEFAEKIIENKLEKIIEEEKLNKEIKSIEAKSNEINAKTIEEIIEKKELDTKIIEKNKEIIESIEAKQTDILKEILDLVENFDQNKSNSIINKLKELLKGKEIQLNKLKNQRELIENIKDDEDKISSHIKIIKDQTLTTKQYNLKNTIYKIDDNPTKEVIDETIEIIKKDSDIKIITPKKQNIVKITRDEFDLESHAKELAKKVGTSVEETKVLISLIDKKPTEITENEVKEIYNEKYESLKPYWFTKFFRMFGLCFNDYDHKNMYLALTLGKFAEENKTEFKNTDLLEFSSKANTLYETYVNNGISEEDFNILLYLKTLEKKENKKYIEIIEKEMNLDAGKILIEDMSNNITKKDNKIYIKNIADENDITENIKMLSYIHKIPTINCKEFSNRWDHTN